MIIFHCDDVHFKWRQVKPIKKWLDELALAEGSRIESLSFVFCSDERLLEINRTHLSHDYYTDIITFDLSEGDNIEGEIYISLHRVRENAETFGVTMEHELCRVMAHGLLHLLGYDDHSETDKAQMRAKESHYLSLLSDVPRGTFRD